VIAPPKEHAHSIHRMQIHIDIDKPMHEQIAVFSKSKRNSTQDRRDTLPCADRHPHPGRWRSSATFAGSSAPPLVSHQATKPGHRSSLLVRGESADPPCVAPSSRPRWSPTPNAAAVSTNSTPSAAYSVDPRAAKPGTDRAHTLRHVVFWKIAESCVEQTGDVFAGHERIFALNEPDNWRCGREPERS
jgi:hypothetical protein